MGRMYRTATIGAVLVLVAAVGGPVIAKPAAGSNWHVGVYNASGRALSNAQASSSGGLASFTFTTAPDTALLTTSQGSQKSNLLGNITGKTVTATFSITGTGPFTYYGQPDGCGTPANTRLYFQTSNAGGFDETHYWWSNPSSQVLMYGNMLTVTAPVVGMKWSDFYGHFGSDPAYASGFASAAANATDIGLSFGGGCFFENGVGAPNATFTLNDFVVSP